LDHEHSGGTVVAADDGTGGDGGLDKAAEIHLGQVGVIGGQLNIDISSIGRQLFDGIEVLSRICLHGDADGG